MATNSDGANWKSDDQFMIPLANQPRADAAVGVACVCRRLAAYFSTENPCFSKRGWASGDST